VFPTPAIGHQRHGAQRPPRGPPAWETQIGQGTGLEPCCLVTSALHMPRGPPCPSFFQDAAPAHGDPGWPAITSCRAVPARHRHAWNPLLNVPCFPDATPLQPHDIGGSKKRIGLPGPIAGAEWGELWKPNGAERGLAAREDSFWATGSTMRRRRVVGTVGR